MSGAVEFITWLVHAVAKIFPLLAVLTGCQYVDSISTSGKCPISSWGRGQVFSSDVVKDFFGLFVFEFGRFKWRCELRRDFGEIYVSHPSS